MKMKRIANFIQKLADNMQEVTITDKLILAVEQSDGDSIKELLKQGADPYSENKHFKSAMTVCCERKSSMLFYLFNGKVVNRDSARIPYLNYACNGSGANLSCVKFLVNHGFDVNVVAGNSDDNYMTVNGYDIQSNGMTPLMVASMHGKLSIVRYLISKGAKIEAQNVYNGTAYSLSVHTGNRHVSAYLESVKDLTIEDETDLSSINPDLLEKSIKDKDLDTINLIAKYKPSLIKTGIVNGNSILESVILSGWESHCILLSIMLSCGLDPNTEVYGNKFIDLMGLDLASIYLLAYYGSDIPNSLPKDKLKVANMGASDRALLLI